MTEADTEFVERYRPLVENIARSVMAQARFAANADDLIGFGLIGLLEARERFDPARGFQFSTFAYYRIRGAMIDGIGKMSSIPRAAIRRTRALSVLDAESEHAGEERTRQTDADDPKQAAIDVIGEVLSRAATAYTLSIMAPEVSSPEQAAESKQSLEAIHKAARDLPERERIVIQAIYVDDRSSDDVALELGVSKSWMSRLHAKALDHLRIALIGEPDASDSADSD